MDEKTQRLIAKSQETFRQLAESQARTARADALLSLLEKGQAVDAPALIAELLNSSAHLKANDLTRLQHEAAARLLGWSPEPTGE